MTAELREPLPPAGAGGAFDTPAYVAACGPHRVERGVTAAAGRLEPLFGPFCRAAMEQLEAAGVYRFDDAYFAALGETEHYVVRVGTSTGLRPPCCGCSTATRPGTTSAVAAPMRRPSSAP